MTAIGNAPVSYGAFEVTVGHDDDVPDAVSVLDAVQAAGYEGIDLGPLGYLGLGDALDGALRQRGLLLTGGYVEIDVTSDEAARRGLGELSEVCDQFDAVSEGVETVLLPRPTVALIAPGSTAAFEAEPEDSRLGRLERIIGEFVDQCARRGYEACLHNEVGTVMATQESIVWALETTPVALCLDTGHLVAASGDPVEILTSWRERVSHVHLKDARSPAPGQPYTEAMALWEGDAFCRLGAGDGRVDEVLSSLRSGGYEGWIVVEQDVLPRGREAYARARSDQVENRAFLRERGW
ncbi:MAG: sugar phosphate isomerase/epimerase family protein [Acidimicrobiales bacterium]|jgi:inosose dehydratase